MGLLDTLYAPLQNFNQIYATASGIPFGLCIEILQYQIKETVKSRIFIETFIDNLTVDHRLQLVTT